LAKGSIEPRLSHSSPSPNPALRRFQPVWVLIGGGCPYRKPKQLTEARESVDSSIDERSLPAQSVGVCQPYTQLTRTRSLVILLSEAGNL
jgi:hypothetical protein